MNADEIRKLEAGRETDALVAEKVMGLIECNNWYVFNNSGDWIKRDHSCHPGLTCYPIGAAPHFSTDIAAAWRVVELNRWVHFQVDRTDDRGDKWYAACSDGHNVYSAFAPTAPLAICRAALHC